MGKPAARIGDMHICPMSDGPKPHVGGPVVGPGVPTVLIGGVPAAVMGDMCTCVSPAPDSIVLASTGVLIGGKPAARMGDNTAHGGVITLGLTTVLIGEASFSTETVGGFFNWMLFQFKKLFSPFIGNSVTTAINDLPDSADNGKVLRGQTENDTCAIASASMAIEIVSGQSVSEDEIKEIALSNGTYTKGVGTTQSKLGDSINAVGFSGVSAESKILTPKDVEDTLRNGGVVIVSVNNEQWFNTPGGHAVVVTGIGYDENGEKVYEINDPWPPNSGKRLQVPADSFESAFNGYGTTVIKK